MYLYSDIIYIQCKRPNSFKFRSGQWLRVSCPSISCTFNEHHAFSIASAPQAPTVELYIKVNMFYFFLLKLLIFKNI